MDVRTARQLLQDKYLLDTAVDRSSDLIARCVPAPAAILAVCCGTRAPLSDAARSWICGARRYIYMASFYHAKYWQALYGPYTGLGFNLVMTSRLFDPMNHEGRRRVVMR